MIDGIFSYNRSASSINKLLCAYGGEVIDIDTGTGYGSSVTAGYDAEFATYLDYLFCCNGKDAMQSFNGTAWSTTGARNRAPIAKYPMLYHTKLYLAYVTINGTVYPSKVWHSDLPYNNGVRWGLEYGTNLVTTAASATVTSTGALFQSYGIKAGDPFFITSGTAQGEYTVLTVDSETQITLSSNVSYSTTEAYYYVGSNFFDVRTDDNDYIRGIGENSDRLLIFKLHSLHKYNGSNLFQIGGALGTSSHRSIVNLKNYTFYFHGSENTEKTGIYLYDGSESVKISTAIQPFIDGILTANYTEVVAWTEGEVVRMYVGDVTNSQRNISLSKVVLSFDTRSGGWSIDPISHTPTCVTQYLESNQLKTFFGDNTNYVFQTPSGYSFADNPIPFIVETGSHYPEGSEANNKFTKIQVIARDAGGIRVRYKLYNQPKDIDDIWYPLGDLRNDRTTLIVPPSHSRGAGINIRFEETSIRENTPFIEKITVFYQFENNKS